MTEHQHAPAEVSREEVASAAEVMQLMIKTSKGFRMYLPNNPLLLRFTDDLRAKVESHTERYGDYRLDVEQFELLYKGKPVYLNEDPKESIAFKIHSDGIRFLVLHEGIEQYELCEFLEIIGKDRPSEVDDDIVTLLWEKDLPHVSYALTEDYLDLEGEATSLFTQKSQQDGIRGVYKAIAEEHAAPTPMLIPQNILSLTTDEISLLQEIKAAEEDRNPLDEVIQILTAILKGEKEAESFRDFLQIMGKLTEDLLLSGQTRLALNLLKFFENLKKDQPSAARIEEIETVIGRMLSDATVPVLVKVLDETDDIPPEELLEALRIFGRRSLPGLCELLIRVERMKVRKILLQALVETGRQAPEVFHSYLSDSRWYVVRNMVFILTRIGSTKSLEQIAPLTAHKELAVRKEVFIYLEKSPDPRAKMVLVKFLKDESSLLRMKALQYFALSGSAFALKPISSIIASEQFSEKNLQEKKAFYEALGALGGEALLPEFREMLLKKFWFKKSKEKDSVVCAVAGLSRIGTPAAVKLLEEARSARNDELRDLISSTLQMLGQGAGTA